MRVGGPASSGQRTIPVSDLLLGRTPCTRFTCSLAGFRESGQSAGPRNLLHSPGVPLSLGGNMSLFVASVHFPSFWDMADCNRSRKRIWYCRWSILALSVERSSSFGPFSVLTKDWIAGTLENHQWHRSVSSFITRLLWIVPTVHLRQSRTPSGCRPLKKCVKCWRKDQHSATL